MKVKIQSGRGKLFECFLYAAMVFETGLATFVYKTSAPVGDVLHLRVYLAILYFGFLAWCIHQLNRLHRKRREFESAVAEEAIAQPAIEAQEEPAPAESAVQPGRLAFGLTGSQFMVVLVVFLTALVMFSWALARMQPVTR